MDTVLRDPRTGTASTRTHERDCASRRMARRSTISPTKAVSRYGVRNARMPPSAGGRTRPSAETVLTHDGQTAASCRSADGTRLSWVEPCGNPVVADTNGVVVTRCRRASNAGARLVAGQPLAGGSRWRMTGNLDVWLLAADGKAADYNLSRHFNWDGYPHAGRRTAMVAFVGVGGQPDRSLLRLAEPGR